MRKNKILASLLLLALLLATLSGCGLDVPAGATSDESSGASLEVEENTSYIETLTQPENGLPQSQADIESGTDDGTENGEATQSAVQLSDIPAFSGSPYVVINNNIPQFSENDLTTTAFENYSDLDSLNRCGAAFANICIEIMPTEERGSIGMIKPSGWQTVKYDIVDGKYLYNRCHLIGFQLAGENANEKNLITGTRYLNVEGMLPFENMVADYVKETENHVLYRVTPIFEDDNLIASGVLMEAQSVEDGGDGILFCVYCYNAQPGITIDYATGDSWLDDEIQVAAETPADETTPSGEPEKEEESTPSNDAAYILNKNSKKFHYPDCSSVDSMSEQNKIVFNGTRDEVVAQGYSPCGRCNP